jgi:hypothetical protein
VLSDSNPHPPPTGNGNRYAGISHCDSDYEYDYDSSHVADSERSGEKRHREEAQAAPREGEVDQPAAEGHVRLHRLSC